MMEAVFKQIKRDGELRRVVRIQFEGAQVGLLQDQISKQEAFQVMRGWMEIQTENTHIVPRWEKERNCWCLSTLWVAGEEQLKYGNRYQLERKKFLNQFNQQVLSVLYHITVNRWKIYWSKLEFHARWLSLPTLATQGMLFFFSISLWFSFLRQRIRNPVVYNKSMLFSVHHKAKTCDTGSLWAVVKLATMAGWSLSQVANNFYKFINLIKYKSESESRRKTLKCSEIFAKSFIGTVKSICHHSNKRTQIMS